MWESYSDSSVGYGLNMCGSVSQLPAGRRFLSSPKYLDQMISSRAHTTSYSM